MKNIILVISVIIGSLIGAGFASGKEIEIFFAQYGIVGIFGIFLSSCFIGWIIYRVLHISQQYQIESYEQFLDIIMETNEWKKNKHNKTEWIKSVMNPIVNLFLLISFFIMVAGFGSYFYQEFGVPKILGAILLAWLCHMTFGKGIGGITKVSSILMPILIGFIFMLGMQNGFSIFESQDISFQYSYAWIGKAILYGSYNTILIIPILFPLKKLIKNRKMLRKICILSVFIIILLATIIFCIILENYGEIVDKEIPMLYAIRAKGQWYQYLYGILILVSIYTSAISAGFGFLENTINKKHQKKVSMIMCMTAVCVSNIGFSSLVNALYPVFGAMGLLQIFQILKCRKST